MTVGRRLGRVVDIFYTSYNEKIKRRNTMKMIFDFLMYGLGGLWRLIRYIFLSLVVIIGLLLLILILK